MTWYYKDGDREIGPISKEDLQALVNTREIDRQTPVRRKTTDEWVPLADFARSKSEPDNHQPPSTNVLPESQTTAASPAGENDPVSETVVCSQCGRSFTKDQVVTYDDQMICADCKPIFVQRLKEGLGIQKKLRYAGFWVRCGAAIIDWIIQMVATWILIIPLSMMMASSLPAPSEEMVLSKSFLLLLVIQQLIGIAIPTFYNTFLIGRYGATFGKMACGLKVVSPEGGKISYLRAFGRYFATLISSIILCIGYLMAAFDNEKRALHDRICSTRVVHK